MPDLLIRDLDEAVLTRLRAAAAEHHRSLVGEIRAVLTAAMADHDTAYSSAPSTRNRVREPAGVYDVDFAVARSAVATKNAWKPVWGAVPGLRANCPRREDIAPVFPDGVPWHDHDPV